MYINCCNVLNTVMPVGILMPSFVGLHCTGLCIFSCWMRVKLRLTNYGYFIVRFRGSFLRVVVFCLTNGVVVKPCVFAWPCISVVALYMKTEAISTKPVKAADVIRKLRGESI